MTTITLHCVIDVLRVQNVDPCHEHSAEACGVHREAISAYYDIWSLHTRYHKIGVGRLLPVSAYEQAKQCCYQENPCT